MSAERDRWLWFSDDLLVESPLSVEPEVPGGKKRAASHPSIVRAMALHAQGRTQAALEELYAGAASPQARAEALLLAGQIQFEAGRYAEAAEQFRRLAEIAPDHRAAQFNRGVALARQGLWSEAVGSFQRAALAAPERPATWFALGTSLLHERRGAEARAAFEHSLKLRPGHAPSMAGQAAALQMEKEFGPALAIYRRLLAEKQDVPELLANALAAAVELGDWDLVRRWGSRLLRLDAGNRTALLALASAAIGSGDADEAQDLCRRFEASPPESFEDWYNLGLCYQRLGYTDDAFRALERAAGLRPQDKATLKTLALLAIERKDAEAAARYHQALDGASWEVSFQLGLLYQDEQRFAEAADLYRTALKEKPDCVEALINLGHVHRSLGQPEQARQCWRKAVELRPEIAAQYFERS